MTETETVVLPKGLYSSLIHHLIKASPEVRLFVGLTEGFVQPEEEPAEAAKPPAKTKAKPPAEAPDWANERLGITPE